MFPHLDGDYMDDYDEKDTLPAHLILGANEYAKIRTNENLHVRKTGEPVAEHTRFGWVLMSPGEDEVSLACLAVNPAQTMKILCCGETKLRCRSRVSGRQVASGQTKPHLYQDWSL